MALWKDSTLTPNSTPAPEPVRNVPPAPSAATPPPAPAAATPPPAPVKERSAMKESVISAGLSIEGKIVGSGHVRVAGIVLVRQRPSTAKGITFVTLEDETGVANLIIRQDVWQRFYRVARTAAGLIAHGRLQRHGRVIHVLVSKLEDLSEQLRGLGKQSRDFH